MQLLILDLDETLVYSVERPLEREPDFRSGHYYVYKRPGVDNFIRQVDSMFELAVWTASNTQYATSVVAQLFPPGVSLAFIWARDRCTPSFDQTSYTNEWAKNLRKVKNLGYDLKRVLMVDDTAANLSRHYGNLVQVRSFQGDISDDELVWLQSYLSSLAGVEDVRQVEKRGWRAKVLRSAAP